MSKNQKFICQYVLIWLRKPFKIVHCVFLPQFQLITLHLNYYFNTAIS